MKLNRNPAINTGKFPGLKTMLVALITIFVYSGSVQALDVQQASLVADLKSRGANVVFNSTKNQVRFVGTKSGTSIAVSGTRLATSNQNAAKIVMSVYGGLFGITNSAQTVVKKSVTHTNGSSMTRFQQLHNGLPVIGGELIVNLDADRNLKAINGETTRRPLTDTSPVIDTTAAKNIALAATEKWHQTSVDNLLSSEPVLSVYDPNLIGPASTFPNSLVWQVEVKSKGLEPIREFILVGAKLGNIVLHFNQIHTAKNRNTYDVNSAVTFDYGSGALPGTLECNEAATPDETCSSPTIDDVDDAHHFAGDTYDRFFVEVGRDSLDNLGMTLVSTVQYCPAADDGNPANGVECPYANAFWNGIQMVYGSGLVVDDVVGHELAHGVTENTANLFYYYQSGAISESYSDLWGEFVDQANDSGDDSVAAKWYIGEDIADAIFGYGIYGGSIRSMSNPPAFGDPDRMQSPNYWNTAGDQGGVHANSGVNNKAVFLMVDGGSFNGQTISGIGYAKVADIYYVAQTTLLTSGADYLDLYNALVQACTGLVGTLGIVAADCTEVENALLAVEMNEDPTSASSPEAALCPSSGNVTATVFSENFEGGLGAWTFTRDTGAVDWEEWLALAGPFGYGPYSTSEIRSLFGNNVPAISDFSARISVIVPVDNPFLHFNHAYSFEDDSFCTPNGICDGGILEISDDSGATWTNASSRITAGRSTNGAISAAYDNPNPGERAFGLESRGYVSTRVDLASYAGQTIWLRWRVSNDFSVGYWGWWLDDVSVYSCDTSEPPPPPPGGGSGGGGGCFIATAAFGSAMADDVRFLRAFRDQFLLGNVLGEKFVELYYEYSPRLASWIRDKDGLRSIIRTALTPLVTLSKLLVDDEVYDKQTVDKP